MSAYAQVLTPPPKVLVDKPKAEEVDAATKVAEHFNAEGFKLDDKPLEDVEKIWLVSEEVAAVSGLRGGWEVGR